MNWETLSLWHSAWGAAFLWFLQGTDSLLLAQACLVPGSSRSTDNSSTGVRVLVLSPPGCPNQAGVEGVTGLFPLEALSLIASTPHLEGWGTRTCPDSPTQEPCLKSEGVWAYSGCWVGSSCAQGVHRERCWPLCSAPSPVDFEHLEKPPPWCLSLLLCAP